MQVGWVTGAACPVSSVMLVMMGMAVATQVHVLAVVPVICLAGCAGMYEGLRNACLCVREPCRCCKWLMGNTMLPWAG